MNLIDNQMIDRQVNLDLLHERQERLLVLLSNKKRNK